MIIGILKEELDTRVALIPETVKKLISDKVNVLAESGCGVQSFFSDKSYEEAGAKMTDRKRVISESDLLLAIHPLGNKEFSAMKETTTVASTFQPFVSIDKLKSLQQKKYNAISFDMIPRITLAQSMDILSSMASIAGYKAVLTAANLMPKYFPMLTTAAGSIPPAKVLVLGTGVAGLQAIATAKRLGGKIEAFDTRLAAKEEVESLGAKFVMVEGAADDKTAGGYAIEQSEEYQQKQRKLIFEKAIKSDVIITTAQLRSKPAPKLVTKEMVKKMLPGTVIVDLASSTGGNCELTKDNEIIMENGVYIVGNSNLASKMPMHASQLYSRNVQNILGTFLLDGKININMENEILKSACVVKDGKIIFKQNI